MWLTRASRSYTGFMHRIQTSGELRHALLTPQSLEDERGPPSPRGVCPQCAFVARLLDHAQPFAELGQRLQQSVEGPVGDEPVASPEVRDHALPNTRPITLRLDDLQVLVGPARLDATLHAHEHAETIHLRRARGKSDDGGRGRF